LAFAEFEFVRADIPVRVESGAEGWQLIYPMTPTCCFVAGPDSPREAGRVVPAHMAANAAEVSAVNAACARGARRSVISTTSVDREAMSALLENSLSADRDRERPGILFGEFWGEIA
jgi:hypothetical protein